MDKKNITGIKEAVSGYRFQFIWTARRCLSMLYPNSLVTQVVIEGLHPDDEINFGQGPESFLGIDTSEYYGGMNFADANRVVVSQLKCGVSHPNRKWTIARLSRRTNKNKKSSSVIGRLASTFEAICGSEQPQALIDKLRIQIVSNCPLDKRVERVVIKAQNALRALNIPPEKWQFKHLKGAGVPTNQINELEKLRSTSGLSSNQFCVFLNCMDLSTFDVESPTFQRIRLIEEILSFDRLRPRQGLEALYGLIEDLASKGGGPIRKEHILSCFETNEANFFPAPCCIERPSQFIETEDCYDLARLIVNPNVRRVLAHGSAGIGKSMTVTAIERLLPSGSVVVVFDCYAGGETGIPSKFRFPEAVLCTQIVNEISIRINQNIYLIRNRTDQADLWGILQEVVNKAAGNLKEQKAFLVLVVDAADNAAESYNRCREQTPYYSFLPSLWRLSLPDNARLVMTCRTHRRDTINSPTDVTEYSLKGFSEDNSLDYLRGSFPNSDRRLGHLFHEKTSGVPRHQYYWLEELKKKKTAEAFREIEQRRTFGLAGLYRDWLSSAKTVLPQEVLCKQVISILRSQAKPVSLEVLSACVGIEQSLALQFCQGLEPGIVLRTGQQYLHFRDEDFESFLDEQLTDEDVRSAHNTLASYCLRTINNGGYSPRYVCMHLFHSGRYKELLDVVLARAGVNSLSDPIERTQCEQERIGLAFKCTTSLKDLRSALRLLFEVGRINRTQSLRSHTLLEYPELVIRHSRYEALQNTLENADDADAQGKAHFRIACELSKQSATKRYAEAHLRKGVAWLNLHIAEFNKQRSLLRYDKDDTVAQAFATLNLHGLEEAKRILCCWRYSEDRLETLYELFRYLSSSLYQKQVLKLLRRCPKLALARAAAFAGMYTSGINPVKTEIVYVTGRLQRWLARHGDEHRVVRDWIVPFLELATLSGVSSQVLLGIMSHLSLSHNERLYHRFSANQWQRELDRYAHFVALKCQLEGRELKMVDLFPRDRDALKPAEPGSTNSHKSDLDERAVRQVESLIPVYILGAHSLVKRRTIGWVTKQLRPLIDKWTSAARDHWARSEPLYETFVLNAVHIVANTKGVGNYLIDELLEPCERIMGYPPYNLYISVAEDLAYHDQYKDYALDLIGQIRAKWCREDVRASESVRRRMKCAQILLRIDTKLSKEYFDEAMEAASGVDDDAPFFLQAVANVAEHCACSTPQSTRRALAAGIAAAIDKFWPLMDEEEHIPWGVYVRAITALDSSIALRAIFDLHDRGLLDIPQVAADIVSGLIDGSQVDVAYALSFHEFGSPDKGQVKNTLRVLPKIYAKDAQLATKIFDKVAYDVMRDAPLHDRADLCRQLTTLSNEHNISCSATRELEQCRDFYTDTENWQDTNRYESTSLTDRVKAEKNWLRKIRRSNSAMSMKLLEAVLGDHKLSRESLRTVLTELANRTRGNNRVDFLNRLAAYRPQHYYDYIDVIPASINGLVCKWMETPGVHEWAQENIPRYLEEHLPELLGYDFSLPESALALIECPVFAADNRAVVLLPSLARHGRELSPRTAYEMAGILARYVPEADAESVAQGLLGEIFQAERGGVGEAEGYNLWSFLYKCFEQPNNRMRWRAFHAARHMLYLKPEPLLSELINLSHCEDGRMWMSAREWLMFLFLHIVQQYSESLLCHAPRIYEHAANEGFPHAGIQELAKRILSLLYDVDHSVLTKSQKKYIDLLNEPRQTISSEKKWYPGIGRRPTRRRKWRFHFDMMDTFPYWYSPLGHCFQLHRCDVAERAERWICDVWQVTSNDCSNYSRHKERGYDWSLFSHRHGSQPTIETLSTYIERHAMFMAAGEMIRTLPIAPPEEEDYGSWRRWISRHLFDADPIITSDLRSPTPLQKFLHGTVPDEILSVDTLPASIFAEQLDGHVAGSEADWIVVAGSYTVVVSDVSVGVSMGSALVSPETARALARAMLSCEFPHEIGIPEWEISYEQNIEDTEVRLLQIDKCESRESRGIVAEGFEFTPWIAHFYTERDMHDMDPHWPTLSRTWLIAGLDFVNRLKLLREPGRLLYRKTTGEPVVVPQSWVEGSYTPRYDNRTTYGHRLNIRRSDLETCLRQVGKDLLINVVISRNRRNRGSSEEYDHGQTTIFIFRQSGKIEVLGRSS